MSTINELLTKLQDNTITEDECPILLATLMKSKCNYYASINDNQLKYVFKYPSNINTEVVCDNTTIVSNKTYIVYTVSLRMISDVVVSAIYLAGLHKVVFTA